MAKYQFKGYVKITFAARVYVDANTKEEAIEKMKAGEFDHEDLDERTDWSNPSNVEIHDTYEV